MIDTSNIERVAQHFTTQVERPQIVGRQAGSEAKEFRIEKLALKEKGYPTRQTKALVKKYLEKNMDRFMAQLDKNSIIVPVPSGSGCNKVTEIFAIMLHQMTGAQLLSPGLIAKTHHYEAKNNLSLEKRISDPIGYVINQKEFLAETKGKTIFILDDLIGSGESSVKLRQEINRAGAQVKGFVNLVTVEARYPTVGDITRFIKKIAEHTGDAFKPKQLSFTENVCLTFAEFTRQKLNRIEREIRNTVTATKAISVIEAAARLEKKILPPTFINYETSIGLHSTASRTI